MKCKDQKEANEDTACSTTSPVKSTSRLSSRSKLFKVSLQLSSTPQRGNGNGGSKRTIHARRSNRARGTHKMITRSIGAIVNTRLRALYSITYNYWNKTKTTKWIKAKKNFAQRQPKQIHDQLTSFPQSPVVLTTDPIMQSTDEKLKETNDSPLSHNCWCNWCTAFI